MDQITFGKYIKNQRIKKKMTQRELAEQLGVSVNSISNIESGRNYPDADKLFSLIKILSLSIDSLMFNESHLKESLLPAELNKKIQKLLPQNKEIVFKTIDVLIESLLSSQNKV